MLAQVRHPKRGCEEEEEDDDDDDGGPGLTETL
jgi:hypothetical protein